MSDSFPIKRLSGPLDALIVDDEPEICETIKMYLEDLELFRNIVIATNGQEAQLKISNQHFALILLDINMPKKSGIELLNNMPALHQDLKRVIMVSGELDQTKLKLSISKGVKNFIIKPFDEETFLKKIAEVLLKAEKRV